MSALVLWPGEERAPLGEAVLAIGVFDGVHLGHQDIIAHAVARASATGARSVVVTFDRDPDQVITPERAAPQLLSAGDKVELLSGLGPDVVSVIAFDQDMALTGAEEFVERHVLALMNPTAVVVGCDFRFGAGASGDVGTLQAIGRDKGFEVVAYELVRAEGSPVTSTRIRAAVARGEVAVAARLLGRRHRVAGLVGRGRGEGLAMGAPTVNVAPDAYAAVPADGVYAGVVRVGAGEYPAGISVGAPPTFPEARDRLEAHLIGFRGDLYGERVTIEFAERLRDQRVFETPEGLAAAIREDLAEARRLAGE